MRVHIGIAAVALGWASSGMAAEQAALSVDRWSPGRGSSAYNHILADCDTLVHSFGRNAAWGRWTIPMDRVRFSVQPDGTDAVARIFVECLTQAGCITQDGANVQPASHYIEFGGLASSEAMAVKLTALQDDCAARRP